MAVVSGAASGIGAALAHELAQAGCHLALCDFKAPGLADTAAHVRSSAVRVSEHVLDVSNAAAVAALPAAVLAQHGRVNLLINNAGVALMGSFEQVSLEDFEWLIGINLFGTVRMTKAFLPLLRREAFAHITNISSVFGLIAPPGQSAYATSKFGVRGFSEALRAELAGGPISLTCVHPGGVRTAIADSARTAAAVDAAYVRAARERFRRVARTSPDEAARQIVAAVVARRPRLLIGADARLIALLARLFPVGHMQYLRRAFTEKPGAN